MPASKQTRQNRVIDKIDCPVLIIKPVVNKNGFIHHLLPVIIIVLAVWAAVIYILIAKGIIKKPSFLQKKADVALQSEYKNPFDKESQYVNPFEESKNPFNNI